MFLDDDGRLYMYYGSSNEYPLKAVELDRNDFYPNQQDSRRDDAPPEEHGWERFGMNNDDEVTLRPFTEALTLTKHNGKYYFMWSEGDWTGPDYCGSVCHCGFAFWSVQKSRKDFGAGH